MGVGAGAHDQHGWVRHPNLLSLDGGHDSAGTAQRFGGVLTRWGSDIPEAGVEKVVLARTCLSTHTSHAFWLLKEGPE